METASRYQIAHGCVLEQNRRCDAIQFRECESAHTGTDNNRVVSGLRRHPVRLISSSNCTFRMTISAVWHECNRAPAPGWPRSPSCSEKPTDTCGHRHGERTPERDAYRAY